MIGLKLGLRWGGGGSRFTPLSLFTAGEAGVWYDPSDLSTLFQDSAGTTPVTAAGQPVGRMLDKSGRGNHATQSTAINRPVLQQDGGGRYYLACDGVDDWMVTSAVNLTTTDKMSAFAGVKKLSNTAGVLYEHSANVNTNNGSSYIVIGTDLSNGYHAVSRGAAAIVAGQTARAAPFMFPDLAVISATHDISGDLSTIRRNGVAGTNGTSDKGAGNFGNYPFYLFRRAGTSAPWYGDFYGLILRGAASTADQISRTEKWMAAKTGVTL